MVQQIPYYSQMNTSQVDWVFQFFSLALGCAFFPVSDPEQAAIVYTDSQATPEQLLIPIWQACYDTQAPQEFPTKEYWMPKEMQATSGHLIM